MRKVIHFLPIAVALATLAGCGSPKPIKYYAFQVPAAPAAPAHSAQPQPIDLLVGRVAGPDLLAAGPIVYKVGPNQVGTYAYHRWADTPLDMVQEKLLRLLRGSGEYRSVNMGNGTGAEQTVRGRLYEFAEVDGESISALVTMEFDLYDRKTGRVLWTHFYSQTEPVQGKLVPSVVQALDHNLDRGLNEVVTGLSKYFAANPPSKI